LITWVHKKGGIEAMTSRGRGEQGKLYYIRRKNRGENRKKYH